MDQDTITQYITDTFDGVDVVVASGDAYFVCNPGGGTLPDRWMPFATLVTSDAHDQFSNLNRPSVFRLNIGVSRDTYRSMFGPEPFPTDAEDVADTGYDFTALDQIMPHPVYGRQHWVCVLNPSAATFHAVRRLLAEAHERAASRHERVRTVDGS